MGTLTDRIDARPCRQLCQCQCQCQSRDAVVSWGPFFFFFFFNSLFFDGVGFNERLFQNGVQYSVVLVVIPFPSLVDNQSAY